MTTTTRPAVITRLMLQSFKSIGRCDVVLRPLTVLVGPNGSGKSNVLDSLRFVADALNTTLDQAVRDRGGIDDVRRRSSGHPNHFGIRLELSLPEGGYGAYSFRIGAVSGGGFLVQRERAVVFLGDSTAEFDVADGVVTGTLPQPPPVPSDRLFLVAASGYPAFRALYDALAGMAFYNITPAAIREHQPPDSGEVLLRDGRNLASVIGRMAAQDPTSKQRLEEYVAQIVPGIERIDRKAYGARETLELRQRVAGAKHPWRFEAASMSDGTLRAVAVLTALLKPSLSGRAGRVSLVGIEEPEVALHPAATGVLLDALLQASRHTQCLATTHSPDLLDDEDIPTESILAVRADEDVTHVGPVDDVGRKAVTEGLYTPGELLRADALTPGAETSDLATSSRAMPLFGDG